MIYRSGNPPRSIYTPLGNKLNAHHRSSTHRADTSTGWADSTRDMWPPVYDAVDLAAQAMDYIYGRRCPVRTVSMADESWYSFVPCKALVRVHCASLKTADIRTFTDAGRTPRCTVRSAHPGSVHAAVTLNTASHRGASRLKHGIARALPRNLATLQ